MALTKFTEDLDIIQKLSDRPNDINNEDLEADALKELFDRGCNMLKEYINNTLIPEITRDIDAAASGADSETAIDGTRIKAGTVGAEQLASGSVGTDEIKSGSVTAVKIADGAVTAGKIGSGAVASAKIADSAVTTAKLGSKAVTEAKLGDSSVTNAKLADGSVTNAKLAASSVGTSKLIDASVTASKIATGSHYWGGLNVSLPKEGWELNSYGLYEQTKTLGETYNITPEKHVGFLGHARGLFHYPGDGNGTWGWSQSLLKSDRKKMACLYSAKIIATDTIKFTATKIPDGTLYLGILFFRR